VKRKLVAIVLLFVLVFSCTFSYVFYKMNRIAHQQYVSFVKEKAPNEVKTIVFSNEEVISWDRVGEEFILNGKLCDVVSIQKKGVEIIIKYISDTEEDAILDQFANAQKQNEHQNKHFKTKLVWVNYLSCESETIQLYETSIANVFCKSEFTYSNPYIAGSLPPPKYS
jgi:hypothetical protein